MSIGPRRMTLLDMTLLVGSAAFGLGGFELAHRTLFKGWIWILDLYSPSCCSISRTRVNLAF
jgi:hypothetical protein